MIAPFEALFLASGVTGLALWAHPFLKAAACSRESRPHLSKGVRAALSTEGNQTVCDYSEFSESARRALDPLREEARAAGLLPLVDFRNDRLARENGESVSSVWISSDGVIAAGLCAIRIPLFDSECKAAVSIESCSTSGSRLFTAAMQHSPRIKPDNFFIKTFEPGTPVARILEAHRKRIAHWRVLRESELVAYKDSAHYLEEQVRQRREMNAVR